MMYKNKYALYESIIRKASNIVKMALNEGEIYDEPSSEIRNVVESPAFQQKVEDMTVKYDIDFASVAKQKTRDQIRYFEDIEPDVLCDAVFKELKCQTFSVGLHARGGNFSEDEKEVLMYLIMKAYYKI